MTRRQWMLILAGIVTTALGVAWLWPSTAPLGVPGEWVWPRIEFNDALPWTWIVSSGAAAAYIGLVTMAATRLQRAEQNRQTGLFNHAGRWGWLTIIVVAGVAWWFALLSSMPQPFGLARSPMVLYYSRMTGYFWEARYGEGTTGEFLRSYEERLSDQNDPQRYLHIGTHPPGMILMYRGLLGLLEASPSLVPLLEATMPSSIHESNADIELFARRSNVAFDNRDAACLWLATLMTFLFSAATLIPLTSLIVRTGLPWSEALRWASLWPFVPAVCVFLPKCDTLFPLPAVLMGWLWFTAFDRQSIVRSFLAGALVFSGLFFTLAFLPVVVWMGLTTVLEFWMSRRQRPDLGESAAKPPHSTRLLAKLIVAAGVGFALPIVLLATLSGLNMVRVWPLNFANHAEFYAHATRTYVPWLFANVIELALAAGPAIATIAVVGSLAAARNLFRKVDSRAPVIVSAAIVLGLLWLSGKNMGEAARLWIPFLPWLLMAAAYRSKSQNETLEEPPKRHTVWTIMALLQAAAAILTSTRIDGFGFSELR